MLKTPFFSIITIVKNGEQYLERAILSVINQSFKNFEYLIIDGGSNDGTLAIIEKYENQIDYWLSEADRGISDAFNKGIQKAKGKYIGFINADDYYVPEALAITYDYIQQQPDAAIFCGAVDFYDGDQFIITSPSDIKRVKIESTIHQSSAFLQRSLFQLHQPFDTQLKYAMDYELFLRLYLQKVPYVNIPKTLSKRDINGTTLENGYKALKELRRIREVYFGKIEAFFNYYFFLFKLALGRFLRERLLFVYKIYWRMIGG